MGHVVIHYALKPYCANKINCIEIGIIMIAVILGYRAMPFEWLYV